MGEREQISHFLILSSVLLISAILLASTGMSVNSRSPGENTIEAVIEPNVWIELEEYKMEIDVDKESNEYHYIRGTVNCDIPKAAPPGYQVKTRIYVRTTAVFEFILHRSLPVLDFQMMLTITKSSPAYTPMIYNFWGNWVTESPNANGPIPEVICEVWVLPFGEVEIPAVVGDISVNEDKWYEFEIPIENNGNCLAEITLQIESEDNVEIDIIQPTIGIERKTTDDFLVRIKVKSGAPDSGNIRMTATSNIQGTNMQDVYTIGYEKDMRIIGPFTAPIIIVFLSTFSLIVIVTLAVIFWRIRVSMKKDGSIPYQ